MPSIKLSTFFPGSSLPVVLPSGNLLIPRPRFRCLIQLATTFAPRDGIIDTGSPLTWFPEAIWSQFQENRDFEWLPYQLGYASPSAIAAGWTFTFRMARLLQPISLFNIRSKHELIRDRIIVQFADGNPPSPVGSKRPPRVVIGLWGGLLEGTSIRMSTDATTGHTIGNLEW